MAKIHVVGISGFQHSGKDFLANALREEISTCNVYHFADPIKQNVNTLFGWGCDQAFGHLKETVDPYWGFTPRKAYQLFGTEFGRALSPDLWVKLAEKVRRELLGDCIDREVDSQILIIPDVRFHNEVQWIKSTGGMVISIWRPEHEPIMTDSGMVFPSGVRMHESEAHIRDIRANFSDRVIFNDLGENFNKEKDLLKSHLENL